MGTRRKDETRDRADKTSTTIVGTRSIVLPSIRKTGTFSIANRNKNRTRGIVGDRSPGWISQGSPLSEADQTRWAHRRVRTAAEFCNLSMALALVVPPKEQMATRIRVSNQLNTVILGGRDNADIRRIMAFLAEMHNDDADMT